MLIAPAVNVPTAVMPVYDPAMRAVLTVPLDRLLALSVVNADPLVPLTHTVPLYNRNCPDDADVMVTSDKSVSAIVSKMVVHDKFPDPSVLRY